jgi:hypothetical protein
MILLEWSSTLIFPSAWELALAHVLSRWITLFPKRQYCE